MNSDTLISWLLNSNWFLLALWIVSLAAAAGATFPERTTAAATSKTRRSVKAPQVR